MVVFEVIGCEQFWGMSISNLFNLKRLYYNICPKDVNKNFQLLIIDLSALSQVILGETLLEAVHLTYRLLRKIAYFIFI